MKRLIVHARAYRRAAALEAEGGKAPYFYRYMDLLQRGQPLPEYARDHALRGKLKVFRSCVIGFTFDERNVVMVYRLSIRKVHIVAVDEHDAAYLIAIDVQRK